MAEPCHDVEKAIELGLRHRDIQTKSGKWEECSFLKKRTKRLLALRGCMDTGLGRKNHARPLKRFGMPLKRLSFFGGRQAVKLPAMVIPYDAS
jgi:hypothetical protein